MLRLACATLLLGAATLAAAGTARAVDLKIGDPAPPFSLVGSDGRTYRLADFAGKQVVVLAWFAKAFTSG
jgi:peroxiredoxin Q/BCP